VMRIAMDIGVLTRVVIALITVVAVIVVVIRVVLQNNKRNRIAEVLLKEGELQDYLTTSFFTEYDKTFLYSSICCVAMRSHFSFFLKLLTFLT
jgi:hypothetical protein